MLGTEHVPHLRGNEGNSNWKKSITPTWIVGVIYMGIEMIFFNARPQVITACVGLILGLATFNAFNKRSENGK